MTPIEEKRANGRRVSLNFSPEEFDARVAATRAELRRRGLSALLVFAQESHVYLTGFDSVGYVFFQAGIITADDGPTVLLTRRPDLQQAQAASRYDDIRLWYNTEGARPAFELKAILEELGCQGERIGVEYATYGLTGANCREVHAALEGFCQLEDGSDIVRTQRLVKSPAELERIRYSGKLADDAIRAMVEATRPGILDSEVTAAGVAAMLRGGGDMPAGGPLVNSGERALYGRGIGGARRLEANDQMMLELGASFQRYNVCIEHTVALGKVDPRQQKMIEVAAETLTEITQTARAGMALGTIDDIHRRVLDRAGFAKERFSACGYSMGAVFRPTWMDVPPMIYSGNPLIMESGMVFFVHIMIPDTRTGLAAGLGQTFVIREGQAEVLSDVPLQLHTR